MVSYKHKVVKNGSYCATFFNITTYFRLFAHVFYTVVGILWLHKFALKIYVSNLYLYITLSHTLTVLFSISKSLKKKTDKTRAFVPVVCAFVHE